MPVKGTEIPATDKGETPDRASQSDSLVFTYRIKKFSIELSIRLRNQLHILIVTDECNLTTDECL